MENKSWILCPSCKGKGHVFDPTILWVAGIGWLDAIFGRNNPDSLSREECGQCGGRGFIKLPESD